MHKLALWLQHVVKRATAPDTSDDVVEQVIRETHAFDARVAAEQAAQRARIAGMERP